MSIEKGHQSLSIEMIDLGMNLDLTDDYGW